MTATALAPIYLGGLLVLAGVAKLFSRGSDDLVEKFQLPRWSVRLRLARVLPWAEVLLGLSLFIFSGLAFAAFSLAVACLTLMFLVLVTRAWLRRATFDCGCFGSWDRARISGILVIRNVLIVGLAAVCIALASTGFPGVFAVVASFSSEDVSWSIVTFFAMVLTIVISSGGRARERSAPPTPSEAARLPSNLADTEIMTPAGTVSTIRMLATTKPCLVVIVKSGCRSCETLMSQYGSISKTLQGQASVRFAVNADPALFEAAHPELIGVSVFAVAAFREKLGVTSFPAAVVIGLNGAIEEPPVEGLEAVEKTLHRMAGKERPR